MNFAILVCLCGDCITFSSTFLKLFPAVDLNSSRQWNYIEKIPLIVLKHQAIYHNIFMILYRCIPESIPYATFY